MITRLNEYTEIKAVIRSLEFGDPIEVTYKPGKRTLTFRGHSEVLAYRTCLLMHLYRVFISTYRAMR